MKTIIVNFKNKTGVNSVIDTLNLDKSLNLEEFCVNEFFGDFKMAIDELRECQNSLRGGGN
ncbi:hypothetical protein [Helicobacter ibis]|uniref:Uncharacterized protein n=1 Tax=Helicobacter ibis TaxID=2962633 RepID=A0ABT4VG96_9HELI|nr:hypothetical protein [Helicobacter ibis]MDA3969130.1 hypothetical protein [Helicobacter ibis]